MSIDEEWSNFLDNSEDINITKSESRCCNDSSLIPKCSDIYISTKTKIIYLNKELDIYSIFWKIKIEDYDKQIEGIIKKQIKISCNTKEELETLENLIKNESYYVSKIINHVDNPNGRIKFKDVRKISVGLCKKDLICSRTKEKSAFYNCFVITLRILYKEIFKEIHVKIFNTGKLEIPGIQNDEILEIVLTNILNILEKILDNKLEILYDKTENVLINSNFNCGFYIDREILFNLLRYKYHINASYDPCSYPGIQCVYYYDYLNKVGISNTLNLDKNMKKDKNIQKISYMIFRTGSILIVGKCGEDVLKIVYEYVKNILISEYKEIMTKIIDKSREKEQKQLTKTRKKMIYIK
jgi:TATA-box binding protein (TBP) (component of TFIID and TFIIIB)